MSYQYNRLLVALKGLNNLLPIPPFFISDLVAQLVEQRPFKAWVVGSSPTGITACEANAATIAQLVEQRICNASVAGSIPAVPTLVV